MFPKLTPIPRLDPAPLHGSRIFHHFFLPLSLVNIPPKQLTQFFRIKCRVANQPNLAAEEGYFRARDIRDSLDEGQLGLLDDLSEFRGELTPRVSLLLLPHARVHFACW